MKNTSAGQRCFADGRIETKLIKLGKDVIFNKHVKNIRKSETLGARSMC